MEESNTGNDFGTVGVDLLMRILIVGGCGFIGSNIADFYAKQGHTVFIIDNFSRARLLNKESIGITDNTVYFKQFPNINVYNMDIRDYDNLLMFMKSNTFDVVIHTAAQTAVTSSMLNPKEDFENNCLGTFNLLEAIRQSDQQPIFLYCSTNKVYGSNVDGLSFDVCEFTPLDLCQHTPYGISKLCGDLYVQEYGYTYGFRTGVFRMSCIYGTRQMGVEDQGWVVHFILSALQDKPITIFGDGTQIRDILYITDLIDIFDTFINRYDKSNVFNIGGGCHNMITLKGLIRILELELNKDIMVKYDDWRPADQKVYISDISKAQQELGFQPNISPRQGVKMVIEWVKKVNYI